MQRVSIEGHTDAIGGEVFNKTLSEERARSVKQALITHTVSAARLEVVGHGKSQPIANNANEAGRAQNRRVEIIIEPAHRS